MDSLLTYGILDGVLTHISQVENGLACNCVCAHCGQELVAKNNPANKKISHFAHYSKKECEGAIETALHLLAKSVLQKTKRITLPDYHYDYNSENEKSIYKASREIVFEDVILEHPVYVGSEKIIPDAIGIIQGKQIFIEFANTHFVDFGKRQKIKTHGVACVEIDLSGQILDENSLALFFNSKTSSKYWIINPRLDKEYSEYRKSIYEKEKLRAQQKAIEEENKSKEVSARFFEYQKDNSLRMYVVSKDGLVSNCPKKLKAQDHLKNTSFYSHPVLKRIINGASWNGQFYGYMNNGRTIFVDGEKVVVFPPDKDALRQSEEEIKANKFFYAGLNEIIRLLNKSSVGDCVRCEFSVDSFFFQNELLEICKYPKE